MMTKRDTYRALDELYARLPTVACQGHCWNTCGPIDMSKAEWERIAERGYQIASNAPVRAAAWAANAPLHCAALTRDRRCAVHDIRPLICRAWGVGRGEMACTHGCEVTGARLRFAELAAFMTEAMSIGGIPHDYYAATELPDPRLLEDPEVIALMQRYAGMSIQAREAIQGEARRIIGGARRRLEGRVDEN